MRNRLPAMSAALLVLITISGPAGAIPIIGSTMTAELGVQIGTQPFNVQDSVTFVVGAGVDSAGPAGISTIDVSANQIVLSGLNISFSTVCCNFNGYRIYDTLGVIDDFVSVTIDTALTTANFTAAELSFTGDEILLNWANAASGFVVGNIVLNITTAPTSVPEPTTLSLLGVGLLAFSLTRLCRRQRSSRLV
jgi:hypothetical protein